MLGPRVASYTHHRPVGGSIPRQLQTYVLWRQRQCRPMYTRRQHDPIPLSLGDLNSSKTPSAREYSNPKRHPLSSRFGNNRKDPTHIITTTSVEYIYTNCTIIGNGEADGAALVALFALVGWPGRCPGQHYRQHAAQFERDWDYISGMF